MATNVLKRFAIFIFFLGCHFSFYAQNDSSSSVFVEAGGSGGFASINFDKEFYKFKNGFLSGRIGVGYFQGIKYFGNSSGVFVIPTMIHCMIGKKSSWFESGFGLSLGISTKPSIVSRITPTIGYRFQKPEVSGIFFRVTYAPILPSGFGDNFQHWGGLSLGYSFVSTK